MNDLSWILYLADVLPSLSRAIGVMCFMGLLVTGVLYLLGLTDFFGDAKYSDDFLKVPYNNLATLAIRFRKFGILIVLLLALTIGVKLFPSDKETYYAIAVSEVGEEVLKSKTTDKAMKALDSWLDKQLDDEETTTK